jgi:hypothetical protein
MLLFDIICHIDIIDLFMLKFCHDIILYFVMTGG